MSALKRPSTRIGVGSRTASQRFDLVSRAVQNIVDMPDTKLRLLVQVIFQNQGKLSASKLR